MDLSIADVNLNTELDFLAVAERGECLGPSRGQSGAKGGQHGGVMGVERRPICSDWRVFVTQSGHQRGAGRVNSQAISQSGEAVYPPRGGTLAGHRPQQL